MATNHHEHFDSGDALNNPEVGYERRDLGHRGIWLFFAFLFISGMVIYLAIGALYKGFDYAQTKVMGNANPMAMEQKNNLPAPPQLQNTASTDLEKFSGGGKQPLLQANDAQDMSVFLAEEENLINAKPWKEPNGTVHLPIDHAMQLVAQRGLTARSTPANPAATDPTIVPTEAGFMGSAAVHQQADAQMVEGAPQGDTMKESESEKQRELPYEGPKQPRNPSRGAGEHQSAGPEQPVQQNPRNKQMKGPGETGVKK